MSAYALVLYGPWCNAGAGHMSRACPTSSCLPEQTGRQIGLTPLIEQLNRLRYTARTAAYGTVPTVVWQDGRGNPASYPILDWLLSEAGQQIIADDSYLYSSHPDVTGAATSRQLRRVAGDRLRPIPVAPGVMAYLDRTRLQRFLKRFEQALGGYQPPPAATRLR